MGKYKKNHFHKEGENSYMFLENFTLLGKKYQNFTCAPRQSFDRLGPMLDPGEFLDFNHIFSGEDLVLMWELIRFDKLYEFPECMRKI